MNQHNNHEAASSNNEQSIWAVLYQNPDDVEVARIIVETLSTDPNLQHQHPALFIRATWTIRRHNSRVLRWKMMGNLLRMPVNLALALFKRAGKMIAGVYTSLVDAGAVRAARPDLRDVIKDPVLAEAFEEFMEQQARHAAVENDLPKAA